MKEYKPRQINAQDIKYFSISLGLLPGYSKNLPEYPASTAINEFNLWIQERLENNQYVFAAKITPNSFIYGFKNDDKQIINNSENAIEFSGEILKKYCNDFDNNEILLDTIFQIASRLGNVCQQERVHISFNKEKYILG